MASISVKLFILHTIRDNKLLIAKILESNLNIGLGLTSHLKVHFLGLQGPSTEAVGATKSKTEGKLVALTPSSEKKGI